VQAALRHHSTPELAYVRQTDSMLRGGGPQPLPPAASAATVVVNVRTGGADSAAWDTPKVGGGAPMAGGRAD
jgi:hypothetical protein